MIRLFHVRTAGDWVVRARVPERRGSTLHVETRHRFAEFQWSGPGKQLFLLVRHLLSENLLGSWRLWRVGEPLFLCWVTSFIFNMNLYSLFRMSTTILSTFIRVHYSLFLWGSRGVSSPKRTRNTSLVSATSYSSAGNKGNKAGQRCNRTTWSLFDLWGSFPWV